MRSTSWPATSDSAHTHRAPIATDPPSLTVSVVLWCALPLSYPPSQCISGIGVTDEKGHLVDVLSVRDLRGIGVKAEHFERLWQSVKRFKQETRAEFHPQTPSQPIYVTEADSFERVLHLMDDGNLHRTFVVEKVEDGGLKLTHVITQRDALRFLLFKMGLESVSDVEPLP